jgi:macrophage erythroblast attacher
MSDRKVVHHFYTYLKLPYYELVLHFKQHKKSLEKEASAIIKEIVDARTATFESRQAAVDYFKKLRDRLALIKETLTQHTRSEDDLIELLGKRVQTLKSLESLDPTSEKIDNQKKVEELVQLLTEEFMARNQHLVSLPQKKAAGSFDGLEMETLACNTNREIMQDLQKKELQTALKWCSIHKSKLGKMRSTFEFNLRQAEFFNILSNSGSKKAMIYLHENFKEYELECTKDLKLVSIDDPR